MTFQVKTIKYYIAALLAIFLVACRDASILPGGEKLEETDHFQFLVKNDTRGWNADTRAGDIELEDWSSLHPLDEDNVPYPNLIIEKNKQYDPVFTTRAPYNPDKNDNGDNQDKDTTRYPIPGTYSLPLEVQSSTERTARLKVKTTQFTDKAINELRALGNSYRFANSRSTIVDDKNLEDVYAKFSLSAICYEDYFSFKEHQFKLIDNELVKKEGDRWQTAENNYYWNVWTDDFNKIRFYAYAPYDVPSVTPAQDHEDGTPQFDFTVPVDVDDQIDLGATAVDAPGNYRRTVPMTFDHILSGVRFLVDDESMARKLVRITLGGVYGTGRYKYSTRPYDLTDPDDFSNPNINAGVNDTVHEKGTWTPLAEPTSEYNLKDKGVDLFPEDRDPERSKWSEDEGDEFWNVTDPDRMMILLPQKLPETAYIEAEFWDDDEQIIMRGKIGGLDSDGNQREWEQGKIYTYVITTFDVEYVLKLVKEGGLYPYCGGFDDKTVVSYAKYFDKAGNIRKIVPVPWTAAFYDRDDMEVDKPAWVNVTYDFPSDAKKDFRPGEYGFSGDKTNDFIKFFEDSLENNVCWGHVVVDPQEAMRLDPHTTKLRDAKMIGTAEEPINLAGLWNKTPYDLISTSNSYIINNPGYFKIPLVYGNAIKNGGTNSEAYRGLPNKDGNNPFVTHDGNPISNPWIKNMSTIKDAGIVTTNIKHAVQLVHLSDDYLTIYVDSAFIGQGNTMVCIRDTKGDIMWSWHIWITDYDPYSAATIIENQSEGTIPVRNNIGETYDFMQLNLGWVHAENSESGPRRTIYWRPVQNRGKAVIHPTDKNNLTENLIQYSGKFTTKNKYRISQDHYVASHSGYAPFYNWGRKDALLRTLHLPYPAGFVTPQIIPGKYSFRRLFDNEELTTDGGKHSVAEGHWFYGNMSLAQSHRIPWPMFTNYNLWLKDGQSNSYEGSTRADYYVTWWNGKYNRVSMPGFVPVMNPTQANSPVGQMNGTGEIGSGGDDYDRFDDLWCIGQNSTDFLDEKDGTASHQVIKTVYDPCPPGFMVPPNRAFDRLNPEDGGGKWVELFGAEETGFYSYGKYVFSEFSNLELPAMPFMSIRVGGGGLSMLYSDRVPQCDDINELVRPGYPDIRFCFPMEQTLFGNACSLWTADITRFAGGDNIIGGSIYNITGNFITSPGSQWGAHGPTAQESIDPRPSSGFACSAGGRQIRAVREK